MTDSATPGFAQAWQLYEEAFPEAERRSPEQQQALLGEPQYCFLSLLDNTTFKGLLGVWQLPGFCFIEHFAVVPGLRGQGIGSQALRQFMQSSATPMVLEVEPPQTESNRRRIKFYERLGFCLNGFDYRQPPYAQDKPWVPLLLMSYPEKLSTTTFQKVKEQLYRNVYQV